MTATDGLIIMVSLATRPPEAATVSTDGPYAVVGWDVDLDPDAPALRFDVTTNTVTVTGADTLGDTRLLGHILHALAHSLMTGVALDLTPTGGAS